MVFQRTAACHRLSSCLYPLLQPRSCLPTHTPALTTCDQVHDGGMPGYVPTLEILMASLDRECLEREYVRPDRHAWWKYGIPWVKEWQTTGKVDGRVLPIHDTTNITKTVES